MKLEDKYLTRVDYQRSEYVWTDLRDKIRGFSTTKDGSRNPPDQNIRREWFDASSIASKKFEFKPLTIGKDLTKSAGLPYYLNKDPEKRSKRANFRAIISNGNELESNPRLENSYPAAPQYRTQQNKGPGDSPDDRNLRAINQEPGDVWYLDTKVIGDAIDNVKRSKGKVNDRVFVDYVDQATLYQRFLEFQAHSKSIVVLDAHAYDHDVTSGEQQTYISELGANYPEQDTVSFLSDWYNKAEFTMPTDDGTGIVYISKDGGMPSGTKGTNLIDSISNVNDIIESLGPLASHVIGIIVLGDDIIVFFNSVVDTTGINKMASNSRRVINADKSDVFPDTAWFAKVYLDPDLPGWTKPVFLVLNSLTFKERESESIAASKYYGAIAATSILNSLENHPFGTQIVEYYWKRIDKYPIAGFTDKELAPAAEHYLKSHSWAVEHGQYPDSSREFVRTLKNSWAAKLS
jgi:hypothetical protein